MQSSASGGGLHIRGTAKNLRRLRFVKLQTQSNFLRDVKFVAVSDSAAAATAAAAAAVLCYSIRMQFMFLHATHSAASKTPRCVRVYAHACAYVGRVKTKTPSQQVAQTPVAGQ
jgi:hypothetical protein